MTPLHRYDLSAFRRLLNVSPFLCNGGPLAHRQGGREPSRMLRILSQRRDRRKAAERIYAVSTEAARHPALFRDYGLPDTLQGRFESLTLHLFAVLHRLMHDPGDDPALARLISESLVTHMDATFREMGVGDTIVPKRMKALYQSFAGRIDAYKRAWRGGRRGARGRDRAECLPRWRGEGRCSRSVRVSEGGGGGGARNAARRPPQWRRGRFPSRRLPHTGASMDELGALLPQHRRRRYPGRRTAFSPRG